MRNELVQDCRMEPSLLARIGQGVEIWNNVEWKMMLNQRFSEKYYDPEIMYHELQTTISEAKPGEVIMKAGIGSSGVAKTGLLAGLLRALTADDELLQTLNQRRIDFKIVSSPMSLWVQAGQLEKIVPEGMHHGPFPPELYSKISQFEWDKTKAFIKRQKRQNAVTVILKEGIPTVYPELEGTDIVLHGPADRSFSPIINAYSDPDIDQVDILALTKDARSLVQGQAVAIRKILARQPEEAVHALRTSLTQFLITLENGQEVNVTDLDNDIQQDALSLLRRSTASSQAIQGVNNDFGKAIKEVMDRNHLHHLRDVNYFRYIGRILEEFKDSAQLTRRGFYIGTNSYHGQPNYYDSRYLIQNCLPTILYPEILGENLRKAVGNSLVPITL